MGLHGEALRLQVHAPPVDGKANQEIVQFFAEALGLKKNAVSLIRGEKSRDKLIEVRGLERDALEMRLQDLLSEDR